MYEEGSKPDGIGTARDNVWLLGKRRNQAKSTNFIDVSELLRVAVIDVVAVRRPLCNQGPRLRDNEGDAGIEAVESYLILHWE